MFLFNPHEYTSPPAIVLISLLFTYMYVNIINYTREDIYITTLHCITIS